jgi:redox-sensitive bicupin YhaK (pirin superfamily)
MSEKIYTALRIPAGGFQSAIAAPLFLQDRVRSVGPFVVVAHALPVRLAPGTLPPDEDVRPHPHIGIATVTYMFEGIMTHRDTLGFKQAIEPGAVNWMIAGRGVVHSERYEQVRRDGGSMHFLQIWVALPEAEQEIAPSFAHFPAEQIPAFKDAGVSGCLLAGAADGLSSPAQLSSSLYLMDVRLDAGVRFAPPSGHAERAMYVISGALGCTGQTVEAGQTLVFGGGGQSVVAEAPTHILSFGGAPTGKRYLWWNFVSSTRERLEAAKVDWRTGRFGLPCEDNQDFTPLPADDHRPLLELNRETA